VPKAVTSECLARLWRGGLVLAAGVLLLAARGSAEDQALVIAEGSVARREVVALGRDLTVAGEALDTVAAVNGAVRVSGRVQGDVIAMGGDVVLERTARVAGDIFVLGGRLEARPGSTIGGRSVSYPSLGSAWLILLEGPSLGLSSLSRVVIAAKLALLAAWLGWALLLFFVVGLSGVLALFLTALFLTALAAALVSVPLLFLVVLIALLLKLWGLVAVFHASGRWLVSRLSSRRWSALNHAVVGLLALGGLKLMPVVGTWVWTVASLIGVGATLTTKFGRREPWLQDHDEEAHPLPLRL
jgi:hypothetical protein